MKPTFRVSLGVHKNDAVLAWIFIGLFAAMGLAVGFLPGKEGQTGGAGVGIAAAVGFALPFLLLHVVGLRRRRLNGLEAVYSPDGIGVAKDGSGLWWLSWDRFGGYRRSSPGGWKGAWFPEMVGYEVLDREGVAVGLIPLYESPSHAARGYPYELWRYLVRELEVRTPEGGPTPDSDRASFEKFSGRKAWFFVVVGSVLCIGSFWLLMEVVKIMREGVENATGWRLWLGQGYRVLWPGLSLLVGTTMAVWGWLALAVRSSRKKPQSVRPTTTPTFNDLRIRHIVAGGEVRLREGARYRYAGAEALRAYLKEQATGAFVLAGLLGLCGIVLLLCLAVEPGRGRSLVYGVLFACLITMPLMFYSLYAGLTARALLRSLDDTFVFENGTLTVAKPDGERLSFPASAVKPVRIRTGAPMRVCVLRDGGSRYFYDPTNLDEVD